ncbi:MAG: phosphoribosylformylglycinamidine synthase subunit PurS [bacterium]|nr:phosphoribosylformylglycinamidine synthase subunit PurS [bacterium]
MRVKVSVKLKPGVLDAEGRAIQKTVRDLGYDQVAEIRTGKLIELDVDSATPEKARALATELCDKILANPVIEQYEIEVD